MIDWRHAPIDFLHEETTTAAPGSCLGPPVAVYRDVLSEEEADLLVTEILGTTMKRRRYEKGHWDSVITHYREVELHNFEVESLGTTTTTSPTVGKIAEMFQRLRSLLEDRHWKQTEEKPQWLPCHAIDLKKEGALNAHVDSVRFSGHLVAGLSLLSPAIMRLSDVENTCKGHVDLFLPPRSLYALSGVGRYKYAHELLPDSSTFHGGEEPPIVVRRDRRLSIIFRDAKPPESDN